jgi:hypothetical protein
LLYVAIEILLPNDSVFFSLCFATIPIYAMLGFLNGMFSGFVKVGKVKPPRFNFGVLPGALHQRICHLLDHHFLPRPCCKA